ncbi:MAG TPA: hypothetical protein VMT70_18060 [Vicinamibacteria bacterium]|nr:hypothetical protein [Vicinamibacteria bacterium]
MRVPAALAASVLLVATASSSAPPDAPSSAGGIAWTVPSGWTGGKTTVMRVATYAVPAAKGQEPGECTVFFFGPGQGGGVDENVARWGRQFEGTPTPVSRKEQVAGMQVTRAEVAGTFLAPGGPMMQSTGKKADYRLLGAIVEAPEGNVFFKLTGPAATVSTAKAQFDALVASIRRR